jgi:hypothetical protein
MTNYRQGKIYRIVCNITGITYYGSTCEPTLARRLAKHVGNYKYFKEGKKQSYVTSFEILEGGNYTIILVELFPCDSKMKLHQRERFYIEGNDCVNKVIPTRTRAEYNVDNRSRNLEYSVNYRLENPDKTKAQEAKYRKENADKIKIRRAEYRANNPEKTKLNDAKYNQKAKEARLANSKLNIPII